MPGVGIIPSLDYTPDLANCPEENRERLMEAIKFAYEWLPKKKEGAKPIVPFEWQIAYDMRPWTAFPE
eukprot:scaffold24526_cov157-Cylindrotheca_fusiformis.AAC.1